MADSVILFLSLKYFIFSCNDSSEFCIYTKISNTTYHENYTICYVPRSIASYKKYGYDHMHELSRLVSKKLGVEFETLYYREKNARVQKELGRAARFYNAEQSIMLDENALVSDRRFILLDDVCVTGASLGRCTTLLINENAREVRCFVIAVRP